MIRLSLLKSLGIFGVEIKLMHKQKPKIKTRIGGLETTMIFF